MFDKHDSVDETAPLIDGNEQPSPASFGATSTVPSAEATSSVVATIERTRGAEPSDRTFRCQIFHRGRLTNVPSDLSELSDVLKEDAAFVWFDVIDPAPTDLALLQEEFALHPLAIEDAVQAHQRPKIESYGSYWFIVVHGATLEKGSLQLHEIALFVGQKFLVSVRDIPPYSLAEIERRLEVQPEGMHKDSGFLLYTFLDVVVDGYFPIINDFEERIDDLQADIFQGRPLDNEVLKTIFTMKKELQAFRRAAVPMRDILTPIIRADLKLFPEADLAYFRDVYDHAVRIIDLIDSARDLVNSALDIHLSVVANRQNEVSKQLTTIATIFLPLTFITGFFGQNFGVLIAHISSTGAFWIEGIGSEIVVVVLLLVYFRHKGWF